MEQRGHVKSYPPVAGGQAAALILGTYPSPKSFELGFYYGHPQNRFWPLLAHLAGRPAPATIAEKRALILDSNLALWDVLESCEILGASDSSIKNPVPNNVGGLLQQTGATAVFCTGGAACRLYRRFWEGKTGIAPVCLPSTSPANAAYSFARLVEAWQPLVPYIGRGL